VHGLAFAGKAGPIAMALATAASASNPATRGRHLGRRLITRKALATRCFMVVSVHRSMFRLLFASDEITGHLSGASGKVTGAICKT